ncbi:MAG: YolD-like family protein [Acetatifactor sp.]|nr:YolD-like family protein [Acetatifactor sp.]
MNTVQSGNYEDIINLPHHVSARHPQMLLSARAAQFSPFAALTGHEDAIRETERLTEDFREPEEDRRELLDNKIRLLQENLSENPEVEVTYFQPDSKKTGGAYVTVKGRVKKIDVCSCRMVFTDQTALALENICSIEGELFGNL